MTIKNLFAAVPILAVLFLPVDIGRVTGAPTSWIPSNVTFERVNETHVQVFYKEKLIETISVPEETTPEPQPQSTLYRPSDQRAGVKRRPGGTAAAKRPPPLDPLKMEQVKRQWMRLNRCYFNPVTCFVGEKS